MQRWLKFTLLLVAFLLMAAIPLAMQLNNASAGSIEGRVSDDLGPVVNASIQVRDLFNGAMILSASDTGGAYRVAHLPPGQYSLRVEADGHDSLRLAQIVVEAGRPTRRDIRLERLRTTNTGSA